MAKFPGPSDTSEAVRVSIAVTVADALAFDRFWTRSAEVRRIVGRFAVGGFVLAGVLAFGTLLVARVALAGGGCDLDENFSSDARLKMLLIAGGSILVLEVLASGLFVVGRQRDLEKTYRTRRMKRLSVDLDHPDLPERFDCSFDPVGFRFDSASLDYGALWATLARLEETVDHMFFMVGTGRGFIVPKRELPPAAILSIRDFARASGRSTRP